MPFYITHLGTVKVRKHALHFSLSNGSRSGGDYPILSVSLQGPNGSSSGFGPKTFPMQEWNRKRLNAREDARAERAWQEHACAYCKGDDDAECECDYFAPPRDIRTWSNSVRIRLPYLRWNTVRRIPSSRARKAVSTAQYRAYAKLYGSLKERSSRLCREAQTRTYGKR